MVTTNTFGVGRLEFTHSHKLPTGVKRKADDNCVN
jgi:hypothetical protein